MNRRVPEDVGDFPSCETLRSTPFQAHMSMELVDAWGDGIPKFSDADPKCPEWNPTPLVPLDLRSDGFGEIFVKDESSRASNPTGTMKDRAAWELATLYRDFARALYIKHRTGRIARDAIKHVPVPRFSLISSGNEAVAVAACFEKYRLPPPKIIIPDTIRNKLQVALSRLYADVYAVDLASHALTTEDILRLTGNKSGVDITSVRSIEPHAIFYDWLAHELFNEHPDELYVPFGSGRLMENIVTWQFRTVRNEPTDPRLKASIGDVMKISVLGGEPQETESIADKLSAAFKPFRIFEDEDISAVSRLQLTGETTGRHRVSEEDIELAHYLFNQHKINAEPSASAGLGLYLSRYRAGHVKDGSKVIVVNTGQGIMNPV